MSAYTPAYFRKLANYYQRLATTAAQYNIPKLICNRLADAAIQFRYAADAIAKAQGGHK